MLIYNTAPYLSRLIRIYKEGDSDDNASGFADPCNCNATVDLVL